MSSHHGLLIHVIFSTKYRKPIIKEDWRDDLFAYIGGTLKDQKCVLLKSGGIEDHLHLLLKIHPQFSISSTIQMMKANSSRWINKNQKTKFKFQWQSGYGAFSVSQSQLKKSRPTSRISENIIALRFVQYDGIALRLKYVSVIELERHSPLQISVNDLPRFWDGPDSLAVVRRFSSIKVSHKLLENTLLVFRKQIFNLFLKFSDRLVSRD